VAAARGAHEIELQFADGRITLGGSPPRKAPRKSDPPDPGEQGSLF